MAVNPLAGWLTEPESDKSVRAQVKVPGAATEMTGAATSWLTMESAVAEQPFC